jgi:hypothetical protein
MSRFYKPDLSANPDSPFVRDASNKLVRRSYWMDMNDGTLVMLMTQGIGANLTNDEKRAHLVDLKRDHLVDQVCIQEILPLEKWSTWVPNFRDNSSDFRQIHCNEPIVAILQLSSQFCPAERTESKLRQN